MRVTNEPAVVSFVVPFLNEEESLPLLFKEMKSLAKELPAFECVLVDDGSTDKSIEIIRNQARSLDEFQLKLVRLSRNFGHQRALLAGMKAATGQACISMDCDLQDPPAVSIQLVAKWKQGFDIVLAKRESRESDGYLKRFTAAVFYRMMSNLTHSKFPEQVGDFRLVSRKVLDQLTQVQEMGPYWRGLVAWMGFKTAIVPYARAARVGGRTKYTWNKMTGLALDAMFSFSRRPLQIASYIGAIVSLLAFAYGLIYVVVRVSGIESVLFVKGWTSVVSLVAFLGGLQLVCLGIMGQYIGRIYEQVLQRPVVIVDTIEDL